MVTASDREEEYKRQVGAYLMLVQLETGWSQSRMARETGLAASSFSRAFSGKIALGFDVLENLSDRSSVKIPDSLRTAYRLRRAAAERQKVDEFIEQTPEFRQLAELMMQYKLETDRERKASLRAQMDELMQKVA